VFFPWWKDPASIVFRMGESTEKGSAKAVLFGVIGVKNARMAGWGGLMIRTM
jgi:hypothetical protein